MTRLDTKRNLAAEGGFYARLLATHEALSVEERHALNARLVLILANHIGDEAILDEALSRATLSAGATD